MMDRDRKTPMTLHHAILILGNPQMGWTKEEAEEARNVLNAAAGPLTAEHLDPIETAPVDLSGLGRLAECYERMHDAADYDRRTRLWLVGAAVLGALLIGVAAWWAYPARGNELPETWQAEPMGSSVTLRPTTAPGAMAELFFNNSGADGGGRKVHTFSLGGHAIEAELGLADPDTIRVTPAEGYIAVPDVLTIPDGTTGVVLIYSVKGVGM
jgi:hypothetical protein